MRGLVEESKISIHYIKTKEQLVDLSTKHLSKHRHRNIVKLINKFKALNAHKLIVSQGRGIIFLREEYSLRISHIF